MSETTNYLNQEGNLTTQDCLHNWNTQDRPLAPGTICIRQGTQECITLPPLPPLLTPVGSLSGVATGQISPQTV